MSTALITGASQGLGRAIAVELASRGWSLVVDARGRDALAAVEREIVAAGAGTVQAIPGDVADPEHRAGLREAVEGTGSLDVLVNNASTLGASPLPALSDVSLDVWRRTYEVNVTAPLALTRSMLDLLQRRYSHGVVINVTSDAAVGGYPGWGGYGSSKAALEAWTAVLAAEMPGLHIYSFDPGDMRTAMHQDAFPGEDISDRPEPSTVMPAFVRLVESRPPSGRYRAVDLLASTQTVRA